MKIVALVNDTTGTLIASAYTDDQTKIGCIFGTGCNAAYMEEAGHIPKLADLNLDPSLPIAINCEWGAFDNEKMVLPRTVYDAYIDKTSPRPGQQLFEKMVAGLYLGEIFRLVLLDLHKNEEVHLFQNQNIKELEIEYCLDASFLSDIENDPWENLIETHELFEKKLSIHTTEPERKLIRRLAELIGTRAARLSACGVAAICKKKGWKSCHVGADGSVFNKYPHFPERQAAALREVFGWGREVRDDPIKVLPAEDGSGVGAALIAALTLNVSIPLMMGWGHWLTYRDRELRMGSMRGLIPSARTRCYLPRPRLRNRILLLLGGRWVVMRMGGNGGYTRCISMRSMNWTNG